MKNSLNGGKYGLAVCNGTITVPDDYKFENHIDGFLRHEDLNLKMLGRQIITDKNYARASNKFCPGKTYYFEIVPIIEYIGHCRQCLNDILNKKEILLFGAQGLALFNQLKNHWIPDEGQLLSFDKEENLFKDEYCEQLPYMQRCSNGAIEFATINFWSSLGSRGYYLLLYYEQ